MKNPTKGEGGEEGDEKRALPHSTYSQIDIDRVSYVYYGTVKMKMHEKRGAYEFEVL